MFFLNSNLKIKKQNTGLICRYECTMYKGAFCDDYNPIE